jgi:hypothetical protein
MNRLLSTTCVLLLVSTLGCGQATDPDSPRTYPISGIVTQGGNVVEGAEVTFQPTAGSHSAVGITDASGKYRLTTFRAGDGAVAGDYRITITKYDRPVVSPKSDGRIADTGDDEDDQPAGRTFGDGDPRNLLPETYARAETSGLSATVDRSGQRTFDFELGPD